MFYLCQTNKSLPGPLQKRHLQHLRSQPNPQDQRAPSPQLRVGQGHKALQSRRGRAVTLAGQAGSLVNLLLLSTLPVPGTMNILFDACSVHQRQAFSRRSFHSLRRHSEAFSGSSRGASIYGSASWNKRGGWGFFSFVWHDLLLIVGSVDVSTIYEMRYDTSDLWILHYSARSIDVLLRGL